MAQENRNIAGTRKYALNTKLRVSDTGRVKLSLEMCCFRVVEFLSAVERAIRVRC